MQLVVWVQPHCWSRIPPLLWLQGGGLAPPGEFWHNSHAVSASMAQWPALAVATPPQPPIPPCVMGTVFSTTQHDCVVLRHMANAQVPATP